MTDNSDKCSICLNSYTMTDLHRPTSLECGHLFGSSCIKKWFNKAKTALCPTCTKKSRLRNLRPIYATEIIVNENTEILERIIKLQEEKRSLEMENMNLKSTIDLLQTEISRKNIVQKNKKNINFSKFKLQRKITYNQKNHTILLEYDQSDDVLLLTFSNDEIFGLKKLDIYNFSNSEIVFKVDYKELLLTNRLESFSHKNNITIKDMKISPHNDNTILICYDKNVLLLNIKNNIVIMDIKLENKIVSVEYDKNDRNVIYGGDIKGNISKINLSGIIETENITNLPIHSIHQMKNGKLFLGTLKGVYLQCSDNFELYEIKTVLNVFGDNENVIFVVRQPDQSILHIHLDKDALYEPNKMFLAFKETRRLRERMYNNNLFIINNEKKSVILYDVFGNKTATFYAGDEIMGICIGIDALYILTIKGFVIFGD